MSTDPTAAALDETGTGRGEPAKTWRVRLICCGLDDGEWTAETWEAADAFRESYTSGAGVNPRGYSAHPSEHGHRRAAIVERFRPAPAPSPSSGTVLGEEARRAVVDVFQSEEWRDLLPYPDMLASEILPALAPVVASLVRDAEQRGAEAIRKLHRPFDADLIDWECYDNQCDHEDACPEKAFKVCLECDGIRESASDEAPAVVWPCATIKALDGSR